MGPPPHQAKEYGGGLEKLASCLRFQKARPTPKEEDDNQCEAEKLNRAAKAWVTWNKQSPTGRSNALILKK